ncbi:hypothetical protein SUDANB105_01541 [Streptomyces sp. enrichment culture]|uniref:hypothetical protein n=1 Tax=Streptomyces sp. enrichment culture TaxID=1795815 RepID=UPI003F56D415
MRTEGDTPLTERVLLVESRADEGALATMGRELPARSANEVALFLSYNYADVPVGRRFDCCYRRHDADDVAWVTTTVVAVTQQFARPMDAIPHGWKTLTVLRFAPGIPALIRELPEAAQWYDHPVSLHISEGATWEARAAASAARL